MTKRALPAAHWSETRLARLARPMQEFIEREQSSGIILLLATILALVVANSALGPAYQGALHSEIGLAVGPWALEASALHWINDGLMAIFFFLVGLEIKREILVGELSRLRAALLPIVAAAGGAIMPALIFLALNAGRPSSHGWGVPMATDIAFAIGCLALLGSRVPFGLKVFLTAVAIVDDLLAVLVIALFYSSNIRLDMLALGLLVLLALAAANMLGLRRPILYAGLGMLVWLAFLQSGVHATIAGVLVAMTVPARARIDAPTFLGQARVLLGHFESGDQSQQRMLTDEGQQAAVIELEELCEQVQAPLQKIEHSLHGWVALAVMPLFAFANAGVALTVSSLSGASMPIMLGIVAGLVVGKPTGLFVSAWLAVRAGIAELPQGVGWAHMAGAGMLAGIGFTMALFIASLSFDDSAQLDSAKIAILLASLIAGSLGMLTLARLRRQESEPLGIEAAGESGS
jgi:NhaA family Na+:H+ antiporter